MKIPSFLVNHTIKISWINFPASELLAEPGVSYVPFKYYGYHFSLEPGLARRKSIFLEPQTTIYKWMFGETTISYVKIWNHPIETTIYKWLFGVPGWTVGFCVCEIVGLIDALLKSEKRS